MLRPAVAASRQTFHWADVEPMLGETVAGWPLRSYYGVDLVLGTTTFQKGFALHPAFRYLPLTFETVPTIPCIPARLLARHTLRSEQSSAGVTA